MHLSQKKEDSKGTVLFCLWNFRKVQTKNNSDNNIALYLDWIGGYMRIYTCQNSQNYIFKMMNFLLCKL